MGPAASAVEHLVHPGGGQRATAGRAAQHHEHMLGIGVRPLLLDVAGQTRKEPVCHRHNPLMPAFALGDEQPPLRDVHVRHPQAEHLAPAQPAQQHRQHDGAVPMRAQRPQQCVNLDR